MAIQPRLTKVFGAVSLGSFNVSALVAGITENGDPLVLGSFRRAAQGVKRGYVTDMAAATYAVRDAVERAEWNAKTAVSSVWVGTAGAGLASQIAQVEIDIGGRRIDSEDIDHLLVSAREVIQPDGRSVLHACPAHYTLDGADGVTDPKGLHAERLGVDIHVMLADGAPIRNITEAVQNAHLEVEGVVAAPVAAGYACLTPEERELGVALVEFGADVTNVSVHAAGMLLGMVAIPRGSAEITDAIASAFGIRRFQAERLKCVNGSALASPADHREMIPVNGPEDDEGGTIARLADDKNRIPRAELVAVIAGQLERWIEEVARALKTLGFTGQRGAQVVLCGGGAELSGLADYAQAALARPVRLGRPLGLPGLPEAHAIPGFATVAGLIQYAAADPLDIRRVAAPWQPVIRYRPAELLSRVMRAAREYF